MSDHTAEQEESETDRALQAKWDHASRTYDWVTWGDEHRFGPTKARLFARMEGQCLMVAAGTGKDFRCFPPGLSITAVDVSPAMIEKARPRAALTRAPSPFA